MEKWPTAIFRTLLRRPPLRGPGKKRGCCAGSRPLTLRGRPVRLRLRRLGVPTQQVVNPVAPQPGILVQRQVQGEEIKSLRQRTQLCADIVRAHWSCGCRSSHSAQNWAFCQVFKLRPSSTRSAGSTPALTSSSAYTLASETPVRRSATDCKEQDSAEHPDNLGASAPPSQRQYTRHGRDQEEEEDRHRARRVAKQRLMPVTCR